jgi:hypothetical protein
LERLKLSCNMSSDKMGPMKREVMSLYVLPRTLMIALQQDMDRMEDKSIGVVIFPRPQRTLAQTS